MPHQHPIDYDYVQHYRMELLPKRDPLLNRLETQAHTEGIPILSPEKARFLYVLALAAKPRRALEIGGAIGYSTIWIARAVQRYHGTLVSIEIEPTLVHHARRNLVEAGLDGLVRVLEGDAKELLPGLRGLFDFIFIDAAKDEYITYLRAVRGRLRRGTVILADNASFVPEYNREVLRQAGLESALVPIGLHARGAGMMVTVVA